MGKWLVLSLLLSACTRDNPGFDEDDLGAGGDDLAFADASGDLAGRGDDLGFGTGDMAPGVDLIGCMPSPEICDGKDNDCNGIIDDGIAGVGVACGSMMAVGGCVEKTACVPGTGVVCLGTFVSGGSGNATNPGTRAAPLSKITDGIRNALFIGGGADVCVCDSNGAGFTPYNEDITMVEGVSLLGGFNCTFTGRNFSTFETRIFDSDAVTGLKVPPGITTATALDGFTVRGLDAAGATSIGITVLNASPTINDVNAAGGLASISVGLYVTRNAAGNSGPVVNRGLFAGRSTGQGREAGINFDNGATGTLTNVIASNVPPGGVITSSATSVGIACGSAAGCPNLKITGGAISGGPATSASIGLYATGDVSGMDVRNTSFIGGNITSAASSGAAGVSLDTCNGSPLFTNNAEFTGGGGMSGARIGFAAKGANCKPTIMTSTNTHLIRGAEADASAATGLSCDASPCNVNGYTITGARRTTVAGVGVSCQNGGCGTIAHNTISVGAITPGQPASSIGVAVDLTSSSPSLDANLVSAPTCLVIGGPPPGPSAAINALHLKNSNATITNNVFRDGIRGIGGVNCPLDGAVVSFEADDVSEPIIHSNTIDYAPGQSYNRVGMVIGAGAAVISGTVRNNIFNNALFGTGNQVNGTCILTKGARPTLLENNDLYDDVLYDNGVQYKLITLMELAIAGATKNISAAPAFDPANAYHLTAGSPCANAGTATSAPSLDRDGDMRPKQGQYDIGADEFVP